MREALVRFKTLDLAEQALNQHWKYLSMQQIDILNTHRKFTPQFEGTPPDPSERKVRGSRKRGFTRSGKAARASSTTDREKSNETVAGIAQSSEILAGVEKNSETVTDIAQRSETVAGVEQRKGTTAGVEQGAENGVGIEQGNGHVASNFAVRPTSDVDALPTPSISATSSVAG